MENKSVIEGINGELFRKQRALLFQLVDPTNKDISLTEEEHELLEGLNHFLDLIADEAMDWYGIDALLKEKEDVN